MEKHYNRAVLLTGGRGVGKTTVCQAVAELTRRQGYRPGGVITPALYACPEQGRRDSHGVKVGFEAVDVGSGERWPLARTDQELGGPQVGPYHFEPEGLARALEVLKKAATQCDLLMVDEIGPLELERGEGFAPVLDLARHWWSSRTARLSPPESCSTPAERETSPVLSTVEGFATPEENSQDSLPVEGPVHTLIVVRPALLDQVLQHLRGIECTVFNVTEENRDELPLRIVETLWGGG
jgi:nucleoside-triphosphatase THEP1